MEQKNHYDAVIIGFGKGGKTLAGLILGAHLFCEESHEIINIIKLAMDTKLPYTALKNMIFTHPTMSEALNDLFNI